MAIVQGVANEKIARSTTEIVPPYHLQIARHRVRGLRNVFSFSKNPAIGSTEEDMWSAGGILVWPSVAGVVSISSTSASDNPAGTGVGVVVLFGLDENWNEIQEAVALNGTSTVTSTLEFFRLHQMVAFTVGANETNVGEIMATIGGNVQCDILPGEGSSTNSHYTVPAGHTLYLQSVLFFQGADKSVTTAFVSRTNLGPWIELSELQVYRVGTEVKQNSIAIEEKSDIRVTAANDGGGTSSFSVIINYFLEKNNP